jgi:hypothetical protein
MDLTPQRAAGGLATRAEGELPGARVFAPALSELENNSVTLCSGMHGGSPAVLIATPSHVVFVSMHGGAARRVLSLGIRHVFLVDESPTPAEGPFAEVTVLAARATVTLTRVHRQRAVEFCNAVRLAILYEAAHRGSTGGSRRAAPSRPQSRSARRPAASETR